MGETGFRDILLPWGMVKFTLLGARHFHRGLSTEAMGKRSLSLMYHLRWNMCLDVMHGSSGNTVVIERSQV